ncbi:MAG: hypothetical protein RL557_260, partial [archaeon]
MKRLKVIMIDAFKPSYLQHAPFLQSLCENYQHGELDMGVGHWNGVQTVFEGSSNVIANFYKNNEGSLQYLKQFTFLKYFGKLGRLIVDMLFNFPRWMKGHELLRTGNIPLDRLWQFDVAVGRHVARNNCDFFYFGELDQLGHEYGTDSGEVRAAIKKIDKKISRMNFDLIFSDHGMINVTQTVRVPLTDDCFIDSDMARYWGTAEELAEIKKQLPLQFGKILSWDERYGQLIFLANTGVLLFPNFWNKKVVKAMHGYDGKHPDMKA